MPAKIPLLETDRAKVQQNAKEASTKLYEVAKSAYGPGSSNVILGFTHGNPLFSHDGVTNIKMVRDSNTFIDDIIGAIRTVSEQNNQKVGDGTTAVVILAHHLLMAAQKMEGLGVPQKEIVAKLNDARETALAYIESIKKPVTLEKDADTYLAKVATISAGDPEIGQMIADIMQDIGMDGGVMIESYEGLGVHPDIVDGFYFNKGYYDTHFINDPTNNQSNHFNVPIFISSRKMATGVDVLPVLEAVRSKGLKEFILLADMSDEAGQIVLNNRGKGIIYAMPVEPPFVSGSRSLFLDDIALLTGGKVYDGGDIDDITEYLGFAQEVLVTASSTTVIGGDGDKDAVADRIEVLRAQVSEATAQQSILFAKERLARLAGKMAKIKVGGALELERDELKLRIQDAVSAVQSAVKEGVVPGGGCTLAQVSGTDFDDAFKQPFRILMQNTGANPDAYLAKLSPSKPWHGFDLMHLSDKPEDMLKLGVIDATLVSKETVRNSISVVIGLIMAGAQLAQPEKD
jgi:chaperonin GroEL